jgi:diacylglycerol kinase family enzyme
VTPARSKGGLQRGRHRFGRSRRNAAPEEHAHDATDDHPSEPQARPLVTPITADAAGEPGPGPAGSEQRRLHAALIINPRSSAMTAKREREIVRTLRECCDVTVLRTQRPGHATELAADAASSGTDVVIACGGDGTGNEVLNGMDLDAGTADERPRFALIPAGGTNVLCRSVGLPNHPVAATRLIVAALTCGRSHVINLGMLDERVFMFSAGIGFDGDMMRRIDTRRRGRRPSDIAHFVTMLGMFAAERWAYTERMTVTVTDTQEQFRSCLVMCGNTSPMSYVGRLGLHFMPDCRLDNGLDFVAPTRQSLVSVVRHSLSAAMRPGHGPDTVNARHDLSDFTVECDDPQPCQVDGEYIGERTHIHFRSLQRAIRFTY